jgi:hypothetical protein
MKNKLSLLFAFCLMIFFAQSASAQYQKGDILINPGLSLGVIGYNYYGTGYSGFLPLTVNAEYSINDKFAIGGYGGWYSRTYKNWDYRFTALSFGARGTFHASGVLNEVLDLNINEEKLDIYGALILGVHTYSWNYGDTRGVGSLYDNGTGLRLGTSLGVRYFFTPKFGAFFELGRGVFGYADLGVSFKL